jgi:hypothetical protein
MGDDDSVTVPHTPTEPAARLRAPVRRSSRVSPDYVYAFADVVVDFFKTGSTRGGERIMVTPMEFKILEFPTKNAQRVISRDELLDKVWGYEKYLCTRTVDNHMLKLTTETGARRIATSPSRSHRVKQAAMASGWSLQICNGQSGFSLQGPGGGLLGLAGRNTHIAPHADSGGSMNSLPSCGVQTIVSFPRSDWEISKTESRFASLNTWRTGAEGSTRRRRVSPLEALPERLCPPRRLP